MDDIFESSVVRGRVTPAGQFPGFESARECFFGRAVAGTSRVENVNIKKLVANDTDSGFTLTQTGFFTFNMNDKVIGFDLSILNLGAAIDPPPVQHQTQIRRLMDKKPGRCSGNIGGHPVRTVRGRIVLGKAQSCTILHRQLLPARNGNKSQRKPQIRGNLRNGSSKWPTSSHP